MEGTHIGGFGMFHDCELIAHWKKSQDNESTLHRNVQLQLKGNFPEKTNRQLFLEIPLKHCFSK
jgi:hypothetical protein